HATGTARPWQLLVLSAKTEAALDRASADLAAHLEAMSADAAPHGEAAAADADGRREGANARAASADARAEAGSPRTVEVAEGAAASALADVAYTLQTGRAGFGHRRVVSCRSAAEAAVALRGSDGRRAPRGETRGTAPRVAFMFPGQGAQYPGMGAGLY